MQTIDQTKNHIHKYRNVKMSEMLQFTNNYNSFY